MVFRSDRDIVIGNIHEQAQRTLGRIRTNEVDKIDEWVIIGALNDWKQGTKLVLWILGLGIPSIMTGLAYLFGQWDNQTLFRGIGLVTLFVWISVLYRYSRLNSEYKRIRTDLYDKEFTKIGDRLYRANEYHRENVEVYYPNTSNYDLEYKDEGETFLLRGMINFNQLLRITDSLNNGRVSMVLNHARKPIRHVNVTVRISNADDLPDEFLQQCVYQLEHVELVGVSTLSSDFGYVYEFANLEVTVRILKDKQFEIMLEDYQKLNSEVY